MKGGSLQALSFTFDDLRNFLRTINMRMSFGTEKQVRLLRTVKSVLEAGGEPVKIAEHFIKHGTSIEKRVGLRMESYLKKGLPFARAFEGVIPNESAQALVAAQHANEEALVNALSVVTDTMEVRSKGLADKMSPLLYPFVFVIVSAAFLVSYSASLAPIRSYLAKNGDASKIDDLAAMADFYVFAFPFIAIAIPMLWLSIRAFLANATQWRPTFVDEYPVLKIYRQSVGVKLIAMYALFRGVGIDIRAALGLLLRHASPFERVHLRRMLSRLKDGSEENMSEADVLDTGLIEKDQVSLLRLLTYNPKDFYSALRSASLMLEKSIDTQLKWAFRGVSLVLWLLILMNLLTAVSAMFSINV